MLEKAASPTGALGKTLARPVLHAFQTQIFPHFCAGEVLADCAEAHAKWARARVKIMIDHSKYEHVLYKNVLHG
jgi:hypothetical protein